MENKITREVIEQYEAVRQAGPCNMLDLSCVQLYAMKKGFTDLAVLTKKEYVYILSNYDKLIKILEEKPKRRKLRRE